MSVIDRTTRLRMRRHFRRGRKQVEGMGVQAEEHLDKHFFNRLTRLFQVRRFVLGWLGLIILLVSLVGVQLRSLGAFYQELQPIPGGTYTEGIIGSFSNANPIYATGVVDTSVSKLVFSGLLKYDNDNRLIGDLAESWKVSPDGKVYTVVLRPDLAWHDGQPLRADDVVFTFQTIKNPDAHSPLFHAWQGITVAAPDARTVTFSLSTPLAPFIYSLTTGIIPRHSLGSIEPSRLRSYNFNTTHPVGSGPFAWDTIEVIGNKDEANQQNIGLRAFPGYHGGGPKLDHFVIRTYNSENQLVDGFNKREVDAIVGLDHVPDTLTDSQSVQQYSTPLTAETMVFLRTDSELLKDIKVRQALIQAVNVPEIVKVLEYPVVLANEPLLKNQLGYNASLAQLPPNVEQAKKLLDEAGWKLAPNETIRSKGATKLQLKLFAANSVDYAAITQQVKKAWATIGVGVEVTLPAEAELQRTINARQYDALVYGISIGIDPDVFAYWHSTQFNAVLPLRLNLSDYASTPADKALESGRSRSDISLRAAKYVPFLQAWRNDVPAIALYQPRFLYITQGKVFGYEGKALNNASDRFNNVQNWMIRQSSQLRP